ncbi:hypothetical protein ACWGR4_01570 [Embleya sp. NPDC055664]
MIGLLESVLDRVQRAILAHDCPAIAALDGPKPLILSDYDYLRDEATANAFEHRVAEQVRSTKASRWVLAVPLVWFESSAGLYVRAVSNLPLRAGEQETITWTAYDSATGVDYGRTPYTRRPNGAPIFDDPEIVTVAVQATENMPGRTLLRLLTEGRS